MSQNRVQHSRENHSLTRKDEWEGYGGGGGSGGGEEEEELRS